VKRGALSSPDAPRHVQWSFDDGGGRVTLTHQTGPSGGRLSVEAPGRALRVRIIGCLPAQISAPAGVETRRDGEHTILAASGGLELAYLLKSPEIEP